MTLINFDAIPNIYKNPKLLAIEVAGIQNLKVKLMDERKPEPEKRYLALTKDDLVVIPSDDDESNYTDLPADVNDIPEDIVKEYAVNYEFEPYDPLLDPSFVLVLQAFSFKHSKLLQKDIKEHKYSKEFTVDIPTYDDIKMDEEEKEHEKEYEESNFTKPLNPQMIMDKSKPKPLVNFSNIENIKDNKSPFGVKIPKDASGITTANTFRAKTGADWADAGMNLLHEVLVNDLGPEHIASTFISAFDKFVGNPVKAQNSVDVLSRMMQFPDLLSNMYTAFLFSKNESNQPESADGTKKSEDDTFEKRERQAIADEFCFRLEGISIPMPKKEVYEIPFLNTSIKGVNNVTTLNHAIDLQIREDSNLFMCSFFEKKSGINKWNNVGELKDLETSNKLQSTPLHSLLYGDEKYKKKLTTYLSSNTKPNLDKGETDEATLVIFQNLSEAATKRDAGSRTYSEKSRLSPFTNSGWLDGRKNFRVWVIEGVRFLGRSSAITFTIDNAEPLVDTFKCIFRQIHSYSNNEMPTLSEALAAVK